MSTSRSGSACRPIDRVGTCKQGCYRFFRSNLFVFLCIFVLWNGLSFAFISDNRLIPNFAHAEFKSTAFCWGLLGFVLYLFSQYLWWLEAYIGDDRTIFGGYTTIPQPVMTHQNPKNSSASSSTTSTGKTNSPPVDQTANPPNIGTSMRIYFTFLSVVAYASYKISSMILFIFSSSFFGSFLTLYMAFIYSSDTFLAQLYKLENRSPTGTDAISKLDTLMRRQPHTPSSTDYEDEFYVDKSIRDTVSSEVHSIQEGPSSSAFRNLTLLLAASGFFGTVYAILETVYTFKLPRRSLDIFISDKSSPGDVGGAAGRVLSVILCCVAAMGFLLIRVSFVTVDGHIKKAQKKIRDQLAKLDASSITRRLGEHWLNDKIASSHRLYRKYFGILGYSFFTCCYRVTLDALIASVPNIAYYRFQIAQMPANSTAIPAYDPSAEFPYGFTVWFFLAFGSVIMLYAFKYWICPEFWGYFCLLDYQGAVIITNAIFDASLDAFFYGKMSRDFFSNSDENFYPIAAFCLSWVFLIFYLFSAGWLARLTSRYTVLIRNQIYEQMILNASSGDGKSDCDTDTLPSNFQTRPSISFIHRKALPTETFKI